MPSSGSVVGRLEKRRVTLESEMLERADRHDAIDLSVNSSQPWSRTSTLRSVSIWRV